MSYKVLKLIFYTQTYSPAHMTETEIHRGYIFYVDTQICNCKFGETSVHLCKGNIKH